MIFALIRGIYTRQDGFIRSAINHTFRSDVDDNANIYRWTTSFNLHISIFYTGVVKQHFRFSAFCSRWESAAGMCSRVWNSSVVKKYRDTRFFTIKHTIILRGKKKFNFFLTGRIIFRDILTQFWISFSHNWKILRFPNVYVLCSLQQNRCTRFFLKFNPKKNTKNP